MKYSKKLLILFNQRMPNLIKKIQNTASRNNLWKKNSKIIAAVSGGPDSTALLDILAYLRPKYNFKLHIAHVNYGLRGKDSLADEKFVRDLANKYNIPLAVIRPKINFQNKSEDNLRKIRYDFFEKLRHKIKFDCIAVAHTKDDQAETVLMRIIRGTGLRGMRAMQFRNGNIVRPMLEISRKEILDYLKGRNMAYRTDRTNSNTKILRNRVRLDLIPHLEKNFNPSIKNALATLAKNASEEYTYMSRQAEIILKKIVKKDNEKGLNFKASQFQKLAPAIQGEFLCQAIEKIKNSLEDIEFTHIEELKKAIFSRKNKIQEVNFKGLKFVRKGDRVTLRKNN